MRLGRPFRVTARALAGNLHGSNAISNAGDKSVTPWGQIDPSGPQSKLFANSMMPREAWILDQNAPDPNVEHKPVYKSARAAKSRIHSFGPTIADKTVQFLVMDDNNNRYSVRAIFNGEKSVYDACAEAGVPGFRRSLDCRPAGERGESSCGACHLVLSQRIYDQTPAPIIDEWSTLASLEQAGWRFPTSRLTCQLPLDTLYDGATLLLPTRPAFWEDHITSRQPSNRVRGNRGNLDSLGAARNFRVTPTRELFVGPDERPALTPDEHKGPTFADHFWASGVGEFERTPRSGKWFPSPRVPKHWNTKCYHLVGGNREQAGVVLRIFG